MIGFVGLGKMGGGLASNFFRKGQNVWVYDIRPDIVDKFVSLGAHASTLDDMAQACEVIFTSLPLPVDVEDIILKRLLPAAGPGRTFIDVSTIDPKTARHVKDSLAKNGHLFLACPLGKGPAQAAEGVEPIFAGGEREVFDRYRSLLELVGSPVYYLGDVEQSTAFKLISNHIGMTNMAILAEGLALGVQAGIDMSVLQQLLTDTGAMSHQLKLRGPWILQEDYSPRFSVDLTVKDLNLVMAMATEWGAPVPLGKSALGMFREVQEKGWGSMDTAAVYKIYRED